VACGAVIAAAKVVMAAARVRWALLVAP
jgi:hypothetical protein